MRILHVSDTYLPTLGGIEVMVSQLAARQRERGHEVQVLTRTPGPFSPGVVRDAHQLDALVSRADVVHVHLSLVSPLAFEAAVRASRRGLPTLASVHSLWTFGERAVGLGGQLWGWARLPIQWAPVSRAAAESVMRALGPRAAIAVLPNAIDLARWAPLPGNQPATPRPVTLTTVGRMAARKRPLAVVDMLAMVRSMVPHEVPLRAVLAGDGPQRERVAHRIERLGMADWVELPGALAPDELRRLYAESDIFLAACRLEAFGLAALEARTAGLAVLARRGTGIEGFVNHGVEGLLVDSDEQMAHAAAHLCTDPRLLERIQGHNRAHLPPLGWEQLLDRTELLYQRAGELHQVRRRVLVGAA